MAITRDVKSENIESAYKEAPYDEAKAELESEGYKIISLEQFAKLRREQGKDSHVANYGAYTREGFLYVPQKGIFLVRNSPIMANAKEATQCHKENREFYLTNEEVEESLKDSVQFKDSSSIPTKRFGEDERTRFAFGEEAEKYGEFLKQAGIKEMPVYLANVEQKPFARQAWLHRLGIDRGSGLNGGGSLLYGIAVRGVKFASADEGSASTSKKDKQKQVKILSCTAEFYIATQERSISAYHIVHLKYSNGGDYASLAGLEKKAQDLECDVITDIREINENSVHHLYGTGLKLKTEEDEA